MPNQCPVPGCTQIYPLSGSLKNHLAQASDKAHQSYHQNLYRALNFTISRATSAATGSSNLTALFDDASLEAEESESEYEGEDGLQDDEVDEVEHLEEREIEVEIVEETEETEDDLDAVARAMDAVLRKLQLSSEEELAGYLSVPNIADEIQAAEEMEAAGAYSPPSSPRQLVDTPDTRITDWHPTAGEVEFVNNSVSQSGTYNSYRPFNLPTDWEIARWALKEKIGQGSLNRLLSIPTVSSLS